ncbi:MAG: hypothetical protein LBC69_01645 [Eubacteriaceae bacterium]|jgi:hypothetical protein|nr:hypothetical protein [Eubacteriaceae bacterium]
MKETNAQVKKIDFHIGAKFHEMGELPQNASFCEHYSAYQLFSGGNAYPNFGIERVIADMYADGESVICFAYIKQEPDHYSFYGKGAATAPISEDAPYQALVAALEDAGCVFTRLEGVIPVNRMEDVITSVAQVLGTGDSLLISCVKGDGKRR